LVFNLEHFGQLNQKAALFRFNSYEERVLIYSSDSGVTNAKLANHTYTAEGLAMVKLSGFMRTLAVTRNPHVAFLAKISGKEQFIAFRNGCSLKLTWEQFTKLRDNYACVEKYLVRQIGNNLFKIRTDSFELVGSLPMLYSAWELDNGVYAGDYADKVVLDVGGFQGESAVFFSKMGSKKVVVYEPVPANNELIRRNLRANNVTAEIHEAAVGENDGFQTVQYDEVDLAFGLHKKGLRQLTIKVKDVTNVIRESEADVAKFDCEGAEISLLNVTNETLRKVERYIIEVHTRAIRQVILKKFLGAGFEFASEKTINKEISVVFLNRN
jgi:FkbM family methyltransferase